MNESIIKKTKEAITTNCLNEINKHLDHLKKGEAVAAIYATLNADGEMQITVTGLPLAVRHAAEAVAADVKETLKGEV